MEYQRLPDLNGWAALKALVQTGGVSAAARVLNVGQSAVTKRLRTLQSCYAMPLTERVDGRLRLTQTGEKVYALAVQTLDRQIALQQEIYSEARGQSSMRLMATHDISEHFLPSLLVRFHQCCPEYQIETHVGYFQQIREDLINGAINLALLECAPDHPDVLVQKWGDDELCLVCNADHPLAQAGSVSIDRLPELNIVLRERGSSPRNTVDEFLRRAGLAEYPVVLELGPTQAVIDILLRNQEYVSFLPQFAVEKLVLSGELCCIKVPDLTIRRSLWIARNRRHCKHPATDAFISMMRAAA